MIVDLERGRSFASDTAGLPGVGHVFEGAAIPVGVAEEATEFATDVMQAVPGEEIAPDSPADVAVRAEGMRVALSRMLEVEPGVKVEAYAPGKLQILLVLSALVECPDLETVKTAEDMHSRLLIEQINGVRADDVDNAAAPMLIRLAASTSPHSRKSVEELEREIRQTTLSRDTAKVRRDHADVAYAQEYLDSLVAELAERQ